MNFKPCITHIILVKLLACVGSNSLASEDPTVASPDGSIRFTLHPSPKALSYLVTLGNGPALERSKLSFSLDSQELTAGVQLGSVERYQLRETYSWRGVHSITTNSCNGVVVFLNHPRSSTACSLEIRAYNDGVAFRYVVPGGIHDRVPDEGDTFVVPAGSTVWYHDENGHYEGVHQKKDIAAAKRGEWAMPPMTYKLPQGKGYASITEAALVNFSGMALQADGSNGFNLVLAHKQPASHPFRLRYSNDVERLSHPAAISGTITSPWRVVMIGKDLNALVNCDMVHNLCPPPAPELFPQGLNTTWCKPGRAVWKYLDGGDNTLEGTKEFCRLAGKLGFEYNIIEGYWSRWSDDEIQELVRYAREQGVGLWFWKHSRSLRTSEEREAFFRKLHDLGVVGAKIDFFDHEHKEVIDLYQVLLADAARHRILVNFHGANKPTGESRTWPNELSREAVRGMEASKLPDRATHDTTLPFTRFLAGHANYTVMHFGARRANTTWAHQVASAAIFDDELQTYVAHPATILTNAAVDLIKSIPVDWDETIVLPVSEIGEVAAFARRRGKNWFVAAMNGTTARTALIPLVFLPSGKYQAMLVTDNQSNRADLKIENLALTRAEIMRIEMPPGGGFIARISPAEM
jgi:alpha-glucosidase